MAQSKRPPHQIQAAWHSVLLIVAIAFLALITIGSSGQRTEPHMGAHVISHDVILPTIGTMPAG